jgi:putative flippase GtrA
MRLLERWVRFNLVGLVGMIVQLGALAALNHLLHGKYLLATALALEVALLHNFAWHVNFTWKHPGVLRQRWRKLFEFHVTAGAISLFGNLVLVRALVHSLAVPLLAASASAIACCSIVNFLVNDRCIFAGRSFDGSDRLDHT